MAKNGRLKASLFAASGEEELERLILAHTPRFTVLLDAAEKRIRKSGGIRHKAFWEAVKKRR